MKKINSIIILLFFVTSGWAQTLSESFDGSTFPPVGWQNLQESGTGLWGRVIDGVYPTSMPHSGMGMAFFYRNNPLGTSALLVSPPLSFSGSSIRVLNFWKYADYNLFNNCDSIGVYYNSAANLTGAKWIATIPRYNDVNGWYKHTYALPASLTGTQYIIFRAYCNRGYNMYLDDVSLVAPPAHDFSAISVDNNKYLTNTSPTIPSATIKNTGTNTESNISVSCRIYNFANSQIYTNTQTITSLAPWTAANVNFASFTFPNPEAIYKIKVWTSLSGDMDHSNDTIVKIVYTYTHNKQQVLLELSTGTWCTYCPGAAMGAEELVSNGHNVAVVENHHNDSYANAGSEARNSYYGITSFPMAVFDGTTKSEANSSTISVYPTYLPIYQRLYAIKTNFGISLGGYYSGNNYNLSVIVDKYGETPFANSYLVLHLALTQSHILQNWQGQTHLEFVNRLMVPNATGTHIDLQSQNQVTVPLSFTFNTAWGGNIANHDFELVAWIQDTVTKEIVDARKLDLASILPVGLNSSIIEPSTLQVCPNPTSEMTTIKFHLREAAQVNIKIYNIYGQLVKTLADALITTGTYETQWNLTDMAGSRVSNGIYLCKVISGKKMFCCKIFVEI